MRDATTDRYDNFARLMRSFRTQCDAVVGGLSARDVRAESNPYHWCDPRFDLHVRELAARARVVTH